MDVAEFLKGFTNFGLSGMLFYMWYINSKKEGSLQQVISQQLDVIKMLREERAEFVKLLREATAAISRNSEIIEQYRRRKPKGNWPSD